MMDVFFSLLISNGQRNCQSKRREKLGAPGTMDDLWSRIQQQNQEVAHEWADYERRQAAAASRNDIEVRMRTHEVSLVNEGQLREQERELDRQLQLEKSLQRGAANERGGASRRPAAAASRPQKLTHANLSAQQQQPEKENRGKISLLPPKTAASGYCPGSARPPPSTAASVTPSERARRPVHFSHMMHKEVGGQMDAFLKPVDGIRGQMRRAGVQPKNHLSEEKQRLAAMAAQRQVQAQVQAEQEEGRQRLKEKLRDRAVSKASEKMENLQMEVADGSRSRGASAGRRATTRPPPTGSMPPPPPSRSHEPGQVPAYLRQRKAEWQAEAQEEAARAAAEAECPPGLRLVGAEEKARILDKLAEERAKAQLELRQMPFVIKTKASQDKKDRLETRLEEIDGAVEAYNKEKVFVPADM